MTKKTKTELTDPSLYLNRELSWLEFNARVLEEAQDASVPLLERLKFACIVSSNLDEFFMVRVARLKRAVAEGRTERCPAGLTPRQQLQRVHARSHRLVRDQYKCVFDEILPGLAKRGIRLAHTPDLSPAQATHVERVFATELFPVLTPMAVEPDRRFPLLANLTLSFGVMLAPASPDGEPRFAVVPIPSGLPRLVQLPADEGLTYHALEDIARTYLGRLFPGQEILSASLFRITRDSELEFDDEGAPDFLHAVEEELQTRRTNHPVRLEVEAAADDQLVKWLLGELKLRTETLYRLPGSLDVRDLLTLVELPGHGDLWDEPFEPVLPGVLLDAESLFPVLREHDVLLHHPYESFEPVAQLVSEAAIDPDVLAIKLTLYRTSGESPIISALVRAAQAGKQVTAVVEVTARFDEERNVEWAKRLEEAGAHVIHGVHALKTHAKILLIVRREPDGIRRYLHLGTGNYNDRTARLYTDLGLLTVDEELGIDGSSFFNALTGYSDPPAFRKLTMAPTGLRERFIALIDREAQKAKDGQPVEILAKMNSLVDPQIIRALYRASQTGVPIWLNVRGICCLRPRVKGVSDTIRVVSLVDRYLEHSRMFYFRNGGDEELYLSSADWMGRNLDRRVELMFPIESPETRDKALTILRTFFAETEKGRWLRADGKYARKPRRAGDPTVRCQQHFREQAATAHSHAEYLTRTRFRPMRRNAAVEDGDETPALT